MRCRGGGGLPPKTAPLGLKPAKSTTMTSVTQPTPVAPPSVKLSITASHDGGNIQLVSQTEPIVSGRTAKCTVRVTVTPDVYTDFESIAHMQYFSFRTFVSGLEDIKLFTITYVLDNADNVSYPQAWPGTTICETVSHVYYVLCYSSHDVLYNKRKARVNNYQYHAFSPEWQP